MKILLISEYLAPVNVIAAVRWTKLVKYLSLEHDCSVDVLTNLKSFHSNRLFSTAYVFDKTLADDVRYFDNVYEFSDGPVVKVTNLVHNLLKAGAESRKKTPRQAKSSNAASSTGVFAAARLTAQSGSGNTDSKFDTLYDFYNEIRQSSFVRNALSFDLELSAYDAIISTYSPKWTHLVAGKIKRDNPNILWLADYRDALARSQRTAKEKNLLFASKYTSEADCILVVSESMIENLCLPENQKVEVIQNGFDLEEATQRSRKASEKFIIAYTGTLYNDGMAFSDMTPLFRAVSELIDQDLIAPEGIELSYCGPNESEFCKQVGGYPSVPWKSHGLVSRSQALELQDKASLLVLCTWNTRYSRGIVTGKVFEYFSSGVPIIGLCSGDEAGSISKEMIDRSRTGFCYEQARNATDYPQLKDYILQKYQEWKANGITTTDPDSAYIQSFNYSNLADRVFAIMQSD